MIGASGTKLETRSLSLLAWMLLLLYDERADDKVGFPLAQPSEPDS
jgi:hypothetical protein